MTGWYPFFVSAVLILWACSTSRDRNALRVVLVATLAANCLYAFVTHEIHGAWKLAIYASVEAATILALLHFARTRSGILNSGCLGVAWLTHLLCYTDVCFGLNTVYDNYETILFIVAVGQIAAFHDTLLHIARSLRRWTHAVRVGDLRRVQPASVRAPLLRSVDSTIP